MPLSPWGYWFLQYSIMSILCPLEVRCRRLASVRDVDSLPVHQSARTPGL